MKKHLIYFLILICLIFAGCSKEETVEPIVMVDISEDEVTYNLAETSMGDIISTRNINCAYVQTKQQDVSFPVGGKIVERVHVKVGDRVKVGDLLVELQVGNIEEDIAALEYQIKKNQLQLGYLDQAEEFDKANSYFSFVYDSPKEEEDIKNKEERDLSIEENYDYQREDYEDNIEFDRRKLEALKKELSSNRIYANMSGKVISVTKNLEGSTAKRGEVIMTIVDNANGLFETEEKDAKSIFKEGQSVSMSIVYGEAKGEYTLTPYNIGSWGEKQTFAVVDGPDNQGIEVGTTGSILAIIDSRENVLRIPTSALYEAEDKFYTYVLDENNMRQAKFLEIGLIGDGYAEVLSGIESGVKVVKR